MDRDRAIQYINELLNSEYDLMQDRKLDTSNPSLYDDEATESEIDEIKSVNDVADAYEKLGLISKIPVKRRLYYFLPNGKYHSFLSNKNHKYAVCCTEKDTKIGGHYTDDYARAKDIAENLNRKMNNHEYGYRKWVVVDIKGGK